MNGREGLNGIWKEFAGYIADFQSRLLLTLFYFAVACFFGILVRLFIDPLKLQRKSCSSNWMQREASRQDLEGARSQF